VDHHVVVFVTPSVSCHNPAWALPGQLEAVIYLVSGLKADFAQIFLSDQIIPLIVGWEV
jgi:hypothetical protein